MLDRLNFIENKYDELSVKISDPSVMADQKEWQKLCIFFYYISMPVPPYACLLSSSSSF